MIIIHHYYLFFAESYRFLAACQYTSRGPILVCGSGFGNLCCTQRSLFSPKSLKSLNPNNVQHRPPETAACCVSMQQLVPAAGSQTLSIYIHKIKWVTGRNQAEAGDQRRVYMYCSNMVTVYISLPYCQNCHI